MDFSSRWLRPAAVVVLALPISRAASHAQSVGRLDSLVPALMREHRVPGVALAIVRGTEVIALRGYGVARVRDSAAVDPERTIFRLASVAKLFVATSVMQLADSGAVDLDADVNRFLNGWSLPPTFAEPVRLRHLLTHTGGFDDRLIGYAAASVSAIEPLGTYLARNMPRRGWPPGVVTGYSNHGMALAAHVVERASGLPFDRYARERLFLRLGMTRTHYLAVPESLRAHEATPHFCGDSSCVAAPKVYSRPYPAGMAYSTAADMARFIEAHLNEGRSGEHVVLSPRATRDMQSQHFTHDPSLPGMAFGFFVQQLRGRRALTHAGNVPGMNNLLVLLPDHHLGFFFVANGGRMRFGEALREAILDQLLPRDTSSSVGGRLSPVSLSAPYLESLAGVYQLTRYAHGTVERFPMLFATTTIVRARGDGRLSISLPGAKARFEPTDSVHFQRVAGEGALAFRRNERGRVSHLFLGVPVFGAEMPGALERRSLFDAPSFMNEYVSWLLGAPLLLLLVAWPATAAVAHWLRRRRGGPRPTVRWIPWTAALGFCVLWGVFGFGFIARSTRMFESATGLVLGVGADMRWLSWLPYVMTPLGLLVTLYALVAWRRRYWDVVRRAEYSFVAGAAMLVIAFLLRWNYLPARF